MYKGDASIHAGQAVHQSLRHSIPDPGKKALHVIKLIFRKQVIDFVRDIPRAFGATQQDPDGHCRCHVIRLFFGNRAVPFSQRPRCLENTSFQILQLDLLNGEWTTCGVIMSVTLTVNGRGLLQAESYLGHLLRSR